MNLLSVSLRNMRVRLLSTTLTMFSIAVGTALLAAIWMLMAQTEQRYAGSTKGYGAIVGPKAGSPLELVLNTVFNFDTTASLLPLAVYRELHDGPLARRATVVYAIPQARGDNYRGFPIIGTTDEMFTKFRRGDQGTLTFAAGGPWRFDHRQLVDFAAHLAEHRAADGGEHHHLDELPAEQKAAVIGADVARELGLGTGDTIVPVHGVADVAGAHQHSEGRSAVVGVLAATGSPIDRSIFVPLSLFLSLDTHDALQGAALRDATPARVQESASTAEAGSVLLSAVIVHTASPVMGAQLRQAFQRRQDAQVAWVWPEIQRLLAMVGDATAVLRVISWLVLLVAAVSVCVALYNTMNERRREIAIMRSLGARRHQIVRIILQEALLVALVGAVLGIVLCHAAAWLCSGTVQRLTSVPIRWTDFTVREAWLVLGVGVVGALAGVLPAIKGSMTQVADNLGPTS